MKLYDWTRSSREKADKIKKGDKIIQKEKPEEEGTKEEKTC